MCACVFVCRGITSHPRVVWMRETERLTVMVCARFYTFYMHLAEAKQFITQAGYNEVGLFQEQ